MNPLHGRKSIPLEKLLWWFRHSRGVSCWAPALRWPSCRSASGSWRHCSNSSTSGPPWRHPARNKTCTRQSVETAIPTLLARRSERGFDLEAPSIARILSELHQIELEIRLCFTGITKDREPTSARGIVPEESSDHQSAGKTTQDPESAEY